MGWRRRSQRPLTRSEKLKRWYRRRFPSILLGGMVVAFVTVALLLMLQVEQDDPETVVEAASEQ